LRRKRTFELERQSKEAEELEQQAMERKKVEAEESKLLQRQQLIEFRRLKRAEVWLVSMVVRPCPPCYCVVILYYYSLYTFSRNKKLEGSGKSKSTSTIRLFTMA
jgi:hypothetical protein